MQDLVIGLFVLLFAIVVVSGLLWLAIPVPYIQYCIRKRSNKIQWKCVETFESRCNFALKKQDYHMCELYWRVLPSELNKFVKIFGDNDWQRAFSSYDNTKIYNKEDFLSIIEDYKTVDDIKKYNDKERGVLWIHP